MKTHLIAAALIAALTTPVPTYAFDENASLAANFPLAAAEASCRAKAEGWVNECIDRVQGFYDVDNLYWKILTPARRKIVLEFAAVSDSEYAVFEVIQQMILKQVEEQENEEKRGSGHHLNQW
jgi:hypothetical protein